MLLSQLLVCGMTPALFTALQYILGIPAVFGIAYIFTKAQIKEELKRNKMKINKNYSLTSARRRK